MSDSIDLQILSIVFVWWLREFWHFRPVGTGPWNFNHCKNKNLSLPLFCWYLSHGKEWYTKWISSSNYNVRKHWFTDTFNSFCVVAQTILTFSTCRHSWLGREILITVKTKTSPFHCFVGIDPTGKNDTLNQSAAQTTMSDSIDL